MSSMAPAIERAGPIAENPSEREDTTACKFVVDRKCNSTVHCLSDWLAILHCDGASSGAGPNPDSRTTPIGRSLDKD